jgi:DNA topoisomerase-2
MVIHEKLIVFKRKRSELEHEMEKIFDKIDNSYDYLLNIKTYQYTHEAVQNLREETTKSKVELDTLQKMSHVDMWKRDLKIYKQ